MTAKKAQRISYTRLFAHLKLISIVVYSCILFLGLTGCAQSDHFATPKQAEKLAGVPAEELSAREVAELAEETSSSSAETPGSEPSEVNATSTANATLTVRFLDVGQGDAALVSCDGHHALIDGGPADASRKVYSILEDLGIDKLDFIIASHPDADHIGGIAAALNYASCETCYCSVAENDTKTFESMKKYLELGGGSIVVPSIPTTLSLGSARIDIIGPTGRFDDTNNGSLVCRIALGSTSFLFTGDQEVEAELALIKSGTSLKSDVLKVAHHGSSSSTSQAFLEHVDPRYAIISVGAENDYGHPTQEVLQRLDNMKITIYRTDLNGSIVFTSNGETIEVATVGEIHG